MYKAVHETLKGTWQNDSKLKELVSLGMNASPQARTVVVTETYRSQSYATLVAAGILSGPTVTVGIIDTDGQRNWLPGEAHGIMEASSMTSPTRLSVSSKHSTNTLKIYFQEDMIVEMGQ